MLWCAREAGFHSRPEFLYFSLLQNAAVPDLSCNLPITPPDGDLRKQEKYLHKAFQSALKAVFKADTDQFYNLFFSLFPKGSACMTGTGSFVSVSATSHFSHSLSYHPEKFLKGWFRRENHRYFQNLNLLQLVALLCLAVRRTKSTGFH